MNQNGFVPIIIVIAVSVVVASLAGGFVLKDKIIPSFKPISSPGIFPKATSSASPTLIPSSPKSTPQDRYQNPCSSGQTALYESGQLTGCETQSKIGSKIVNISESFTMKKGDEVEVANTGLRIKVTDIQTPPEGTYDLPNYVEGKASYQGKTEEFNFSFSGMAIPEVINQRRQKKIFETFNIYMQKVTSNEVTFIIN